MDRRNFIDAGFKSVALAAIANLNPFVINSAYAQEEKQWDQETFKFPLGDFSLHSGEILKDAYLLVDIQGKLNSAKDNAIIFPTCFTGSHNFNSMAYGVGRALDPTKYAIITACQISSGHSSSPSNQSNEQGAANFPLINYYDDINAQDKLITEYFGISNPLLYFGFSMGAQQAFHWGALHGAKTGGIVPLCGTAKTTTQNWMALEGCVNALELDPAFNAGSYTVAPTMGINAFAQNYISQYCADVYYKKGLHLKTFGEHKDLRAYRDFFNGYFNSLDANDLLSMVKKWQAGDLGNHSQFGGDWKKALANVSCPALVMPSTSDICFPPRDNVPEVAEMPDAKLIPIESDYGHLVGCMTEIAGSKEDIKFIDDQLKAFLKKIG